MSKVSCLNSLGTVGLGLEYVEWMVIGGRFGLIPFAPIVVALVMH